MHPVYLYSENPFSFGYFDIITLQTFCSKILIHFYKQRFCVLMNLYEFSAGTFFLLSPRIENSIPKIPRSYARFPKENPYLYNENPFSSWRPKLESCTWIKSRLKPERICRSRFRFWLAVWATERQRERARYIYMYKDIEVKEREQYIKKVASVCISDLQCSLADSTRL